MIQKTLFSADGKTVDLLPGAKVENIQVSILNPRKTWNQKHVELIAQSIEANGYDATNAIKCHEVNGVLYVFAGSNRLKACQHLKKPEIPVFLYSGYTDEEIWKMAYDDNEQADIQAQFNIVDIWMDYKAKSEAGWTQQKIADVLGIDRTMVSKRIALSNLPVIEHINVNSNSLNERCCLELLNLCTVHIFDNKTLLCEIIDNVCARAKDPTSAQFKAEVERYNAAIKAADRWAQKLEDKWKVDFLAAIQDKRTESAIDAQGRKWTEKQADDKAADIQAQIDALSEEQQAAIDAKEKADREKKIQEVLNRITCGDSRKLVDSYPDNIKLVFTDPPYGKDFQSNRRTATEKAGKIANDGGLEIALQVTSEVLQKLFPKMANDSAVLLWCDWKYEPEFRVIIEQAGFEIKNSIIWAKPNHGTGDLNGSFAPKHERIIFAAKGRPVFTDAGRLPDVQTGAEILNTEHPTPKPIDLIERLIVHLTYEKDIIADPFNGSGATAMAAIRSKRVYYGTDLENKWIEETHDRVNKMLKDGY